jgi:hypothetical protein
MQRRIAAAVVSIAACVLALGPGCSAIAARDPGPPPCDFAPPDPDPCPAPTHCVDGFCTGSCASGAQELCNGQDDDCNGVVDDDALCDSGGVCVEGHCRTDCAAAELCNMRDDDCDGSVDENLDIDGDGDGFVSCNTAMPSQSDCNDRDPAIHPGATEMCNGFDDDCNPATSDLSAHCDAGLLCAVPMGETVPRCINPRDCTLVPCGPGELCGADSMCCTMGTAGCGAPTDCRTTGCASTERCVPQGAASMTYVCMPLTPLGGTCSTDRDCATGHCFTRDSLRLTSGASGICGAACCVDSDCSAYADAVCWAPGTGARSCVPRSELSSVSTSFTLCTTRNGCGTRSCEAYSLETPQGSGGAWECQSASSGTLCGFGTSCPSGICEPWSGLDAYCINPCGSAADCSSSRPACLYLSYGGQWLTGCGAYSGRGQGEACSNDSDCRDFFCLNSTCADVCCSDATCSGGSSCSPVDHSGWEMRCLPRAPI